MKQLRILPLLSIALGTVLAGCGGTGEDRGVPDSPASAPAALAVSGVFLDSAVQGLSYIAGSAARASTGANGEFVCLIGDRVSFSVGGLAFGDAPCAATITPLQLAGFSDTKDIKDTKVVNRLLMLQMLDDDNDPANGIKLDAEVSAALAEKSVDFNASAADFDAALRGHLVTAGAGFAERDTGPSRRLLASEHFEDTLATKVGKPVAESFDQTTPLGPVRGSVTRYQIKASDQFYIPYEGSNVKVKHDFPHGFLPSYGSAIAFKGTAANGDLEFYGLTDRGPNGDGPNVPALSGSGTASSKIFPAPSFTPSVGLLTIGKKGAVLSGTTPIKISDAVNMSGLPLPSGSLGNSAEVPVLDAMRYDAAGKAVFNANGFDSEALAFDAKRNVLWVADEYGPFIIELDLVSGLVLKRYAPGTGLPAIFAKRRANRGIEGMTLDPDTDKLHAFLQSPLSDGSAPYAVTGQNEQIERFARFTRWTEFDPGTGTAGKMYAYPLNGADYQDGRTGNAKLGDMVALGGGKFIVIEQGEGSDKRLFNKLMLVEINGATDIASAIYNPSTSDLEKSSMGGTPVAGADWSSVTPMKKTLLLDLNAVGWLAGKAEGLTLVDASTLALANDNDFGLKTKIFNPDGKAVADADVTKCNVDAAGVIIAGKGSGCDPANAIRVTRGDDKERPSRLWLIKFSKALSSY